MRPALANRYIGQLIRKLENKYPLPEEADIFSRIQLYRAIRHSDAGYLTPAGWSDDVDGTRDYLIDPLGERIPWVWSDLLFAKDPVISPVNESDHSRMDDMIQFSRLPSRLRRAEWVCSSEGEVWWRITPNPMLGHAVIDWHSRAVVTPLWIGEEVGAVAFVSELERDENTVWRYMEVHGHGTVHRKLYRGEVKNQSLGEEVSLESRPETADWPAVWDHGLEILAGRIVNKLGDDCRFGISDYEGITDMLLALNELTTIGQENARLTAKQRAIVPQRFLDMKGNWPKGAELLVATEVDQDPERIKNQVAMIEFEFDASALIAYTDHLTDRILTRARVAPQLVGRHTEGAQTGPALRARILDSELSAQGKGKAWDDEMPSVLNRAAMVEKLSTGQGGLGIKWGKLDRDPPSFNRASAFPEDEESKSRRLSIEINADMLSRKTAIRIAHPEWDERRVEEEVNQIMLETGMNAPEPDDPVTRDRTTTPEATTAPEKEERRDDVNR